MIVGINKFPKYQGQVFVLGMYHFAVQPVSTWPQWVQSATC